MVKILAIPLASELHGVKYYESILEVFKEHFKQFDIEVLSVVKNINESKNVAKRIGESPPLLIFLTGGTSKLARIILSESEFRAGIALAHGQHNSLASALSARSKLDLEGIPLVIFTCTEPLTCGSSIERCIRVGKAAMKVKKMRIGIIGPKELPEEARYLKEIFDSEAILIPHSDVLSEAEKIDKESINKAKDILRSKLSLEEINVVIIDKILSLYLAMRRIVDDMGLDALAIDCFPFLIEHRYTPCIALAMLNNEGIIAACEADLRSLVLMVISKELTGYSGWIANPSMVKDRELVIAHCTIAPSMIKRGILTTHFESNYPYSISGELKENTYTLTSISYDFTEMAATKVRIARSGMISPHMCRTQAVLELDFSAEKLIDIAVSNHHVLIPGDVREELRYIAELLGIGYIDYGKLALE